MKVFVVGYGIVGSVISKLLQKEKSIDRIICADINLKNHTEGKITFKFMDITDERLVSKILRETKPDILINASLPKFNTLLMKYCIKNRTNYLDTAAFWDFDKNPKARSPYKIEQFDYDKEFKKHKLFALIEAGVSPGLTNILARECADKLDTVESMKIRLFEDTGSEHLSFPWSKEWLLDEINWKPLVYRNGKFRIVESFSEGETYDFPHLVGSKNIHLGKRRVYMISQDEIGTIPLFIKMRNADIKAFDNQVEVAKIFVKLGMVSEEKISIGKTKIAPFDFLVELLPDYDPSLFLKKSFENGRFAFTVEMTGYKNRKKKAVGYFVLCPKQKDVNRLKMNANFISYPTAAMAKSFAMAIIGTKTYGVYPPECLNKETRKHVLDRIKKYGVMIREFTPKK